ncbi:hypothetical protein EMIT0P395_20396 [Pseudomonas sp. IT-P395]
MVVNICINYPNASVFLWWEFNVENYQAVVCRFYRCFSCLSIKKLFYLVLIA